MTFDYAVDDSLLRPVVCSDLQRFGSPNDGGYVVPVGAIYHASVLLSFGLSVDWRFERDALECNPKLAIHAYDHTVGRKVFARSIRKSIFGVPLRLLGGNLRGAKSMWATLQISLDYFRFFKGNVEHYPQRVWYNEDRGSASIKKIIERAGTSVPQSIFAKIDIEGSEYRILPEIIRQSDLFSGLVIEFHDTDICAEIFNEQIGSLREHFAVVHLHGNNFGDLSIDGRLPLTWEITLMHKKLLPGNLELYTGQIPRPGLDAANDPSRDDYVIVLSDSFAESVNA